MSRQNIASGPELAQSGPEIIGKLGRSHVDYWKARLVQRTYEWEGKTIEIPEWQIRIRHDGRREWFNLGTPNKTAAAAKARDIYLSLFSAGWTETLKKFKREQEPVPDSMSIAEFCELFRQRKDSLDRVVSKHTAERYVKSLTFICRHLKITKLSSLTSTKIETFKDDYRAQGRKEKRNEDSVKVSLNTQIRNAAAMFSKRLLAAYQSKGHTFTNPFEGQQVRGVLLQTYTPVDQSVLDKVWEDSALLRDGDPKAAAPKKGGSRWTTHDFREPNLAAYGLLLLELGLGLRRNEADKAQRDWIYKSGGQRYLTVQDTPYFKPKSKECRTIRIPEHLFTELEFVMGEHVSPFILPGRLPKQHEPGKEPKNIVYRCDAAHRALTAWLQKRGMKSNKPCHQLRKEFGSFVATDPKLGLYAAQKLLGHSSPQVTEQFYAGQRNVPQVDNVRLPQKKTA